MDLVNLLVGPILALIIAAVVLMIVSRFKLGLTVDGFGSAIIAAIVIAIIGAIVNWILGLFGINLNNAMASSLLDAIVYILVAAAVLLLASRWLKGLQVAGYSGALIAAIAIGVVYWIIDWIIGLFM